MSSQQTPARADGASFHAQVRPTLGNNIIQKGLAFGRDWSGVSSIPDAEGAPRSCPAGGCRPSSMLSIGPFSLESWRRLQSRAIHGVVRWRACDLIMRLHVEFGLSVSDDTIYRALKNLGFSHVSARPKAYKQNAEAMDAFKKTSPSVWRKSARSSHPTHR
jgi:hypothetical protein